MKPGEIAAKLGISVRQLQRRARKGQVPGVRLKVDGYHSEYPELGELRAYIKNCNRFRKGRLPGKRRKKAKPSISARLAKASRQFLYWYRQYGDVLDRLSTKDLKRIQLYLEACVVARNHVGRVLDKRE